MKSAKRIRFWVIAGVVATMTVGTHIPAQAADKYWDIDGTTSGSGPDATPDGAWSTGGGNWNFDPLGASASGGPTTWASTDNAFFSAGTDATGTFTVTPSGSLTIGTLTVQEGTPTLPGGTLGFVTLTIAPDNGQVSTLVNNGAAITSTGAGTYAVGAGGSATGTGNGTYTQTAGSLSMVSGANAFNIASGSASTGLVDVSGGSLSTNLIRIGARGVGQLDVSGTGSVTAASITVGTDLSSGSGAGSTGTMNVDGGTVLINGASGTFTVGNYRPGTYTQTAGTVTYASGSGFALNVGNNAGGAGTIDVSGGTLTTTGFIRVAARAAGTLTISGTGIVETTNASGLAFGLAGAPATTGTVNLDGGTLKVKTITPPSGDTGIFNFNGGTLQATASDTAFMTGLTTATVKSGGAIIDTNGFDITIGQALLAGAPSGGLTLNDTLGTGTLTLSSTGNTYTGATTINAGTLNAAADGAIPAASAVTVNSGGTLRVTSVRGIDTGGTLTVTDGGTVFINNNATNVRLDLTSVDMTGGSITGAANVNVFSGLAGTTSGLTINVHANATASTIDTVRLQANPTASGSGVLTFETDSGAQADVSSVIYNGAQGVTTTLTKSGDGTLTLSGANVYSGLTSVDAGTLLISGSITGAADVNSGGTLGGSGSIGGLVTLNSGGTIAPGDDSVGQLMAAALSWLDGGTYTWDVNDSTGTPGADWDLLDLSGALTFPSGLFTVEITSLDTFDNPNPANGFVWPDGPFTFEILSAGSISGFDASNFTLDTSAFANSGYAWSIYQLGNSLFLTATPVPEPATILLLGLAGLLLAVRRRKRRRAD